MVDCTGSSSRPHWKVGQYLVESSLIRQSNYLLFLHHHGLLIRLSGMQLIKGGRQSKAVGTVRAWFGWPFC
jgi:hypothetical protein